VLDEATANLDASIELELHRALTRTAAGRATLIVAHRRSTVERADRVIVLEDGRIIADTTPDGLAVSGTWWNAPPGRAQQARPGEDEMLGGGEPGRSR
jgi:ABC efflux pump (fragment)